MEKLSLLDKIAQSRGAQIALFVSYFVICFLITGYFLEPKLVGVATWPWALAVLRTAVLWLVSVTAGLTAIFYFFVSKLLKTNWRTALQATVHISSLSFVLAVNFSALLTTAFWWIFRAHRQRQDCGLCEGRWLSLVFFLPFLLAQMTWRLSARVLQTYRPKLDVLQAESALKVPTFLVVFIAILAYVLLVYRCVTCG